MNDELRQRLAELEIALGDVRVLCEVEPEGALLLVYQRVMRTLVEVDLGLEDAARHSGAETRFLG